MFEEQNTFKQGAYFYAKEMGTFISSEQTRLTNGEYLSSIQKEIENLYEGINKFSGNENPQLKGYIAEVWHTYTFNINAVAKHSSSRVTQENLNTLGSVDISTNWGNDYSLKYYKSGADSAIAQSHSLEWAYQRYINKLPEGSSIITREKYLSQNGIDPKTDMSLCMYEGQARLIPSDQIHDAIEALNKKITKELNNLNNPNRLKTAERLIQVRNKLTSHIKSPDCITSMNLTEAEANDLAKLAKEGKFNPKRFNITLAKMADFEYICKNVMKAGLNAAWISALIKMMPEIISSLKKLLKDKYISIEDLKNIGQLGVSGAKEGFLKGFLCAAISTSAEMGLLGKGIEIASKSTCFAPVIGTLVVIVSQSISDGIKYSQGELSDIEYVYNIEKSITIAASSVFNGLVLQTLIPLPIVSYAIGSMIGSLLGGLVFSAKEQIMMSLCVKHGFTVFGLVEQDYTMPPEIRKKLGFPVFGVEDYIFMKYKPKEYKPVKYHWKEYKWQAIDCVLLKRGVIGCRKIAYI